MIGALVLVLVAIGGVIVWQLPDSPVEKQTTATGDRLGPRAEPKDTSEPGGAAGADSTPTPRAEQSPADYGPVPDGLVFGLEENAAEPGMGHGVGVGSPDAPVVIEVYEDFMCPHCAYFHNNTRDFLAEKTRSGEVRVVYYPMTLDGFGEPTVQAANAYACAVDAGAGQEFAALLYARNGTAWTDGSLLELGRLAGLESGEFADCVSSDTFDLWVTSIQQAASFRLVGATPTVFVNGVRVREGLGRDWTEVLRLAVEESIVTS